MWGFKAPHFYSHKKMKKILYIYGLGSSPQSTTARTLGELLRSSDMEIVTTEYEGKTETHRCFKSWKRVSVPCEDKPGYYRVSEFGWTPIWIVVDEYLKSGNTNRYLADEFITNVDDVIELDV